MNDTFLGRMIAVFNRPGALMDAVGRRPMWWQPGLLLFLIVLAFGWLTMPIAKPEQAELMRHSRLAQMVPEAELQRQYDEALDIDPTMRVIEATTAAFTTWLSVIIFGFILGFFARMSGGQGTFRQALGVTSWAALIPFALGTLIKAPLILATESMYRVNIGLGALLPDAEPGDVLFQALIVYGDFATWWGLALLVIGFQRVFALSRGTATATVLAPWFILSLIPLGLTLLFL